MVAILYQRGCRKVAQKVAADLAKAFAHHVTVVVMAANSPSPWPAEVSWDDLLIVMFDGKKFPDAGNHFIRKYLEQRPNSAILLPVALDPSSKKPPEAAATIKALKYDRAAKGPKGRLAKRVGGMLGLRVQGRDTNIFISYRQCDGAAIAKQLHEHLVSVGHRAFLDEAIEFDGEPSILPGSPVQRQIDDNLNKANLVLLIDTPTSPASPWIKHEVDTADALLLPILPLCFRDKSDRKIGPRFPSLVALQRSVLIQRPDPAADPPLSIKQLENIVYEAETYLCEIFQRKCKVPFLVKKEFVSHGFAWKVLDQRLLMFESSRSLTPRVLTKVLSHCSLFDPVYSPALKRFAEFLKSTARCNHSLFIYDGELLPDPILNDIAEAQSEPVIILHHQELAALVDSNFTSVVAA
jgi:TIR domain-containing protein